MMRLGLRWAGRRALSAPPRSTEAASRCLVQGQAAPAPEGWERNGGDASLPLYGPRQQRQQAGAEAVHAEEPRGSFSASHPGAGHAEAAVTAAATQCMHACARRARPACMRLTQEGGAVHTPTLPMPLSLPAWPHDNSQNTNCFTDPFPHRYRVPCPASTCCPTLRRQTCMPSPSL